MLRKEPFEPQSLNAIKQCGSPAHMRGPTRIDRVCGDPLDRAQAAVAPGHLADDHGDAAAVTARSSPGTAIRQTRGRDPVRGRARQAIRTDPPGGTFHTLRHNTSVTGADEPHRQDAVASPGPLAHE
ncbi:MAG TPA: hypothetical protein VMV41_16600, partial [Cellulomonadaceae bacterium]|nr:hypothetical protein [Cellulomonadaceae bacterium]